MAKSAKRPEAYDNYAESAVDARRRSLGWALEGSANMIQNQHEQSVDSVLSVSEFLDSKEQEALAKVQKTLASCEAHLRKLASRLGIEK